MTDIHSTCPYCGVGCGVVSKAGWNHRRGDPSHPANFGRLCSKGAALGETLDDWRTGFLNPSIGGRAASWDDAARPGRRAVSRKPSPSTDRTPSPSMFPANC